MNDLILAVYLEDLLRDRRVWWIGDPAVRRRLESITASLRVHDTTTTASGEPASLGAVADLERSDRVYDFVVVVDHDSEAGGLDLNDSRLSIVGQRAERGVIFCIEPSKMKELPLDEFSSVHVLGLAPFAGVAIASLSEEPDSVVVDGTLVDEPSSPEWLLVVCSGQRQLDVEPAMVVQAPSIPSRGLETAQNELSSLAADLDRVRAAGERHQSMIDELQGALGVRDEELRGVRTQLGAAQGDFERRSAELNTERGRAKELEAELRRLNEAHSEASPHEARDEVDRLEARLSEQGRRVRDLETERRRLATLVRDLVHRLEANPPSAMGSVLELRAAVDRAVAAEAANAEASFELDELRARIVELEAPGAGPHEEAASVGDRADVREELERARAELAGLRGELMGQAHRLADAEAAAAGAVASASQDVIALRAEIDGLRHRLVDAEAAAEAARRSASETSGAGQAGAGQAGAGQAGAGQAGAGQAGVSQLDARPIEALLDELDSARAEIESLRREVNEAALSQSDLDSALADARQRLGDLISSVAAKDALITRLQLDLADEENRARVQDGQIERFSEENQRLRTALFEARAAEDQAVGEADAVRKIEDERDELRLEAVEQRSQLEAQVAQLDAQNGQLDTQNAQLEELSGTVTALRLELEGERRVASETREKFVALDALVHELDRERSMLRGQVDADARRLNDAAAELASLQMVAEERDRLQTTLAETRQTLESLRSSQEGEGSAGEELGRVTAVDVEAPTAGDDVAALQAKVRDRDTMIESLMAQLEERNERIESLSSLSEGFRGALNEACQHLASLSEEASADERERLGKILATLRAFGSTSE